MNMIPSHDNKNTGTRLKNTIIHRFNKKITKVLENYP